MPATTIQQLKEFGAAIRDARIAMNLSQEVFAERALIHRTYVGQIELGHANISFQNITRIANALGVKPSTLWRRAGL